MTAYAVHPVAELFPFLEGEELQELAESIRRNGLVHAVMLHEGKIIDGRNRLRACEIAGVEPRFSEWTGDGDPSEWIFATNLQRRHLNPSQRALIGLELKKFYEGQAHERKWAGRPASGPSETAAADEVNVSAEGHVTPEAALEAAFKGKASEQAARAAGVSARSIERAEQLVAAAAPELVDAVRAGQATVWSAVEVAKLPKEEQVATARDKRVTETARAIREGAVPPTSPARPPVIPPVDPETPLNLEAFKAAYKRAPALSKRRPIHEVHRLEQIVATVALAERAWRWIATEWDVDQRKDLAFATGEVASMTPLLVDFRERLADIVDRCRNDGRELEDC
ncbi:MAG: ParB/RepB/Spo0J family partition protein [Polyangiaceae bacterium]